MSALFQLESSDQRDQPESLQGVMLTQALTQYQQLRLQEKKLRMRVDYLEKQIARHQYVSPKDQVEAAMLLLEESEKLTVLRQELELQEKQLKELEALPFAQRTAIEAESLEQLINDIKAKREQVRIQQWNLNYLEEKQAQFGVVEVRLDLANELKLAQTELEKVRIELGQLEIKLKALWQLEPSALPSLDMMDETQIKKFAYEIISQREALEHARIQKQKEAFAKKYDELVKAALHELREAAYSGLDYRVASEFEATGEAEWKLYAIGSFGGVHVMLKFDGNGKPIYFQCARLDQNNKPAAQLHAELSRESLIETLKALHQKEKRWWKFWAR